MSDMSCRTSPDKKIRLNLLLRLEAPYKLLYKSSYLPPFTYRQPITDFNPILLLCLPSGDSSSC